MTILSRITFMGLFILLAIVSNGQYFIKYPKWFPETKLSHLYIEEKDSTSVYAKQVYAIIKSNWTLCPVSFFPYNSSATEQLNLLKPGNLFLSSETSSSETVFNTTFSNGGGTRTTSVANDYFHFNIYSYSEKPELKELPSKYKFVIASAELFNRTIGQGTLADESNVSFVSSKFRNDFCNGMLGNIKNMVQYFNTEIPLNNPVKFLKDYPPTSEIKNLQKDTLFVPNYWYGGIGTMLADEKEDSKYVRLNKKFIDEMISKYGNNIKLISLDEWNNRILNATKNFYYLNYIQSSADKIISVVNGYTGAVIYSEVTRKSYRIKDKDFTKINEAVQ